VDPFSQGVLGAAWAQPAADRSKILAASLVGGASAMTPDLDLLIRSGTDPLLAVEFHRHFTHSLAFAPFGALLCALLLYPLFKATLGFRACYGFSLLGFLSHGLLDACTGYGTLWLWPMSHSRIAWDLISVIDPLFTLPLFGFVVAAAMRRRPVWAVAGILWCLCYIGLGYVQHERAVSAASALAADRGHAPVSIDAKPSLGNLLLWKTIYADSGRFFVDAVRVGVWVETFTGGERLILDLARDLPWLDSASQQATDVERFRWFADGYVALDPDRSNRIVDLRYSLVPNSMDAFWGIDLDPLSSPDDHVAYVTMRTRTMTEGRELLSMLFR
jgi:inner membrane protein